MQTIVQTYTSPFESQTIEILEGQEVRYLVILYDQGQGDITFSLHAHSKATIKVLCLGTSHCKIQHRLLAQLVGDGAEADVYMLSLLQDDSDIDIHGNVTLGKNVYKVSGHLLEENIILWQRIRIKTAPILDVHSSDVRASHWCRVERLDPKKLFYMQSRWLSHSESQALLIDGYLGSFFEGYDDNKELYQLLREKLLSSS